MLISLLRLALAGEQYLANSVAVEWVLQECNFRTKHVTSFNSTLICYENVKISLKILTLNNKQVSDIIIFKLLSKIALKLVDTNEWIITLFSNIDLCEKWGGMYFKISLLF